MPTVAFPQSTSTSISETKRRITKGPYWNTLWQRRVDHPPAVDLFSRVTNHRQQTVHGDRGHGQQAFANCGFQLQTAMSIHCIDQGRQLLGGAVFRRFDQTLTKRSLGPPEPLRCRSGLFVPVAELLALAAFSARWWRACDGPGGPATGVES